MDKTVANLVSFIVAMSVLEACSAYKTKSSSAQYYVDPVCGMKVDKNNSYDYKLKGVIYHFDSYNCKETFEKNPEKFLGGSCNAVLTKATPKEDYIDPVCNKKVEKSESFDFKYKDKTYHFDSYDCKKSFEMNPEKFIKNSCDTISKK